MKVLIITKSFTKGGSASGASYLAAALESAGVEVVCLDGLRHQKGTWRGAARVAERVCERALFGPDLHCLRLARAAFDLPRIVAEYQPDIIQVCDVSGNVIDFSQLDHVHCPVVHRLSDFWPYHGPLHYAVDRDAGNAAARWLLRKTVFSGEHLPDMRVAPSHWLASLLARTCDGRSPVRVIRNAVPIPAKRPEPRLRPEGLRFGFISNKVLDPRKGFRLLLSCLEAFASEGTPVSLQVYGRIAAHQRISLSRVEVEFHGPFVRRELPQVFDSFDVLLCPSQLDNSPNVLCEALAHGRPVIAQSGGGMESYLDSSVGALIDFSAATDEVHHGFRKACARIAAEYASYSRNAVSYAEKHFSPRSVGLSYLELYRDLLARRAGGPV